MVVTSPDLRILLCHKEISALIAGLGVTHYPRPSGKYDRPKNNRDTDMEVHREALLPTRYPNINGVVRTVRKGK